MLSLSYKYNSFHFIQNVVGIHLNVSSLLFHVSNKAVKLLFAKVLGIFCFVCLNITFPKLVKISIEPSFCKISSKKTHYC